jgi:hypothetical protein
LEAAFHLWRQSQLIISQNAFTEIDILSTVALRIAHLVKSIYGGRLFKRFAPENGGHFWRWTSYEAYLCKS